jgi:hypothetical protein
VILNTSDQHLDCNPRIEDEDEVYWVFPPKALAGFGCLQGLRELQTQGKLPYFQGVPHTQNKESLGVFPRT